MVAKLQLFHIFSIIFNKISLVLSKSVKIEYKTPDILLQWQLKNIKNT